MEGKERQESSISAFDVLISFIGLVCFVIATLGSLNFIAIGATTFALCISVALLCDWYIWKIGHWGDLVYGFNTFVCILMILDYFHI